MATNFDERPEFYEDQYLGADDLNTAVGYGRAELARHSLGAHTWGIAVGLEIVEKPVPGAIGQVDNYLTPGYAWDGFGRVITVLAPYKLPPDLFTTYKYDPAIDSGGTGRLLEVWLRYWEDDTQAEGNAYAACDTQGRALRALENFRFVQASNPTGMLLKDHSVPFQDWPTDEIKTVWLIPVGYVRWQPVQGGGGFFVARDPSTDNAAISAFRHYAGVVAGQVEAAAGVIRLHDRGQPYSTVQSPELVWVEGDLRVEGDVRPFGKALDFLDANGLRNASEEMQILRADVPASASALRVVIGHDKAGANSFSVGPLDTNVFQPKLTVLDSGKVGIGTGAPALTLDIQGDFGRTNGAATLNLWASQIGDVGGGTLFLRSGGSVVAFDGGDCVGIGTATPVSPLQVSGDVTIEQRATSTTARVLPVGATTVWNDGTWLRLNQNIDFSKPIFGVHTPGLFAPNSLNVGGLSSWGDPGPLNAWFSGNIGVGHTFLRERIDVNGNIRLGAGGSVLAAGGEENLRILRGSVHGGINENGTGYTTIWVATGICDITFNSSFPGRPSASVTQAFGGLDAFDSGGDTRDNAVIVGINTTRLRVKVGDSAGAPSNRDFSFLVIGPR